jgi:hypothetical protein
MAAGAAVLVTGTALTLDAETAPAWRHVSRCPQAGQDLRRGAAKRWRYQAANRACQHPRISLVGPQINEGGRITMRWTAVAIGCLALVGCAKGADQITASYVSPLQFEAYDCQQLQAEGQRISARASQLSGVQDRKASDDALKTGAAIVLFWPAAFFVQSGDGQTAGELAQMKGQFEAVQHASVQKKCPIQFQGAPAT